MEQIVPTMYDHAMAHVDESNEREVLESYGEAGWELVGIIPHSYHAVQSGSHLHLRLGEYRLFFKKRRN